MPTQKKQKSGGKKRAFAAMDKEKQREIASKGGKAAHEQGVAHEWNSQEAISRTVDWYEHYYENASIHTQKDIEEYVEDLNCGGI